MANTLEMEEMTRPLVGEKSGALLAESYTKADMSNLVGLWKHFTHRGHKGRVNCVDAGFEADIILTGGVDYSTRIWKWDSRYDAYDLIAVLNVPTPVCMNERREEQTSLFKKIKDIIRPPKVDWDKEDPQGVTALTAIWCQRNRVRPDGRVTKAGARNGPIVNGTEEGNVYILDLSRQGEAKTVWRVADMHSDVITDAAFVAEEPTSETEQSFLVCTVSKDKTGRIMRIYTDETDNPEFSNHKPPQFHPVVDVLFCGGGGRKAARLREEMEAEQLKAERMASGDVDALEREEDDDEEEDPKAWRYMRHEVLPCVLEHPTEVFSVRSFGGHKNLTDAKIAFATCSEDGAHMWSSEGEQLLLLRIEAQMTKLTLASGAIQPRAVSCPKHLCLAAVNKERHLIDEGMETGDYTTKFMSLLFMSGEDAQGFPQMGVWGIEDGIIGTRVKHGTGLAYSEEGMAEAKEDPSHKSLEPVCVYEKGGSVIDVDQSGVSTTFAVQVKGETVDLWNTEAVAPGKLVFEPEGPASLLICPGREQPRIQMIHTSKVCDIKVVSDPEGPAMITSTDEGTAFVWDLEGDDEGQVYAEMRSLTPQEILLPPINLIVTTAQIVSFAFGPAIPWKQEVHHSTVVYHKFMMLDFKYTLKFNKEDIFWPEIILTCMAIVFFQICALVGLPEKMDQAVRSAMNTECFRNEKLSVEPCHIIVNILKGMRRGTYLAMQLLSTVLVVPMFKSCAQAVDCNYMPSLVNGTSDIAANMAQETNHFLEIITMNPNKDMVLASAPNVLCYRGDHLKLLGVLFLIVPLYLLFLIPYAVCGGDAKYVPRNILFDWKLWKQDNTWRRAAKRKATDLHLAVLHVNPREAFRTLLLELMGKIMLPVITTLTTTKPIFQMALVSLIGFILWFNALFHAPYVQRKFCVFVQDLKLFTFGSMACGLLTVCIGDPESWLPVYVLVSVFCVVFITMITQLVFIQAEKPKVEICAWSEAQVVDEESPLLKDTSSKMDEEGGAAEPEEGDAGEE